MPNLIISELSIRQDAKGRTCLNDLHRAAVANGANERTKEPAKFIASPQTIELVKELETTQNPGSSPVNTIEGRNGGTFVVKELVYAYAMWISPTFHLKVIRAYDAMVAQAFDPAPLMQALEDQAAMLRQLLARSGRAQLPAPAEPRTINKAQQGEIHAGAESKAQVIGQRHKRNWFLARLCVHFKLARYQDLPAGRFEEALDFLDRLQIEEMSGRLYGLQLHEWHCLQEARERVALRLAAAESLGEPAAAPLASLADAPASGTDLVPAMAGRRILVEFGADGHFTLEDLEPDELVMSMAAHKAHLERSGYVVISQGRLDAVRDLLA